MEEVFTVIVAFAGLGAFTYEVLKKVVRSFMSKSIDLRLGHLDDDDEIKIADIENLSREEIDALIGKLQEFQESTSGGVKS